MRYFIPVAPGAVCQWLATDDQAREVGFGGQARHDIGQQKTDPPETCVGHYHPQESGDVYRLAAGIHTVRSFIFKNLLCHLPRESLKKLAYSINTN